MKCSKSSPKRETYVNVTVRKKKSQTPNFTPQGTKKRTN